MSKCFILIHTDGYSIHDQRFSTENEAVEEMQRQYDDYMPENGLSDEWEELSYINDMEAILYDNGENVHVWRIIRV